MPPPVSIVGFGLTKFAEMTIRNDAATVIVTNESVAAVSCAIYCWVIGEEIVRIGSSNQPLRSRVIGTGRWIEARLRGTAQISNPLKLAKEIEDARRWADRLKEPNLIAEVYGRRGTIAATPLGDICLYLSEENWLLEKFRPPLNNSHFR